MCRGTVEADRRDGAPTGARTQHARRTSNRRIGTAVGILMSQRQLTQDEAVALLEGHSQLHDVEMRELAETVIHTGQR